MNKTVKLNTLYLNRLSYDDLKNFPIKLQIFFILKFAQMSTRNDIDCLIGILKKYDGENNDTNNAVIFSILSSFNYEIAGLFVNTTVLPSSLKKEYFITWDNLVKACVCRSNPYFASDFSDISFDIILLMCEKFKVSIYPQVLPKLIKLNKYNEDTAIYMLKSEGIKFRNNTGFNGLMKMIEIMYDDAIQKGYNILGRVIRTIPYFVATLEDEKIVSILQNHPEVLVYNLNSDPVQFDILRSKNDVISVRLKHLSYDDNATTSPFQLANKIMSLILTHKITFPLNKDYNKIFYNYVGKIYSEIGIDCVEYSDQINYSDLFTKVHLEIMAYPVVQAF